MAARRYGDGQESEHTTEGEAEHAAMFVTFVTLVIIVTLVMITHLVGGRKLGQPNAGGNVLKPAGQPLTTGRQAWSARQPTWTSMCSSWLTSPGS